MVEVRDKKLEDIWKQRTQDGGGLGGRYTNLLPGPNWDYN